MHILFVLFAISLLSIFFMLGRKVALIRNGAVPVPRESYHPLEEEVVKAKLLAKQGVKRYGYLALVVMLRIYFRLANALKNGYHDLKDKAVELIEAKTGAKNGNEIQEREASGFLQMVSEYKHKIRNIRHKIKEEEEKK